MVKHPDGHDPTTDPALLAEHGRFVRNLAWRLLHDEDAAEDVVQETMLAAVKAKPAADRSLRPWLATVARNVIRRRFRSKKRIRRREEAGARPEAVPSTFDMAARAEMLRDVVDAVLGLDEPNRSTILLRFYEDLPPREIAAQQGVGVETVRGRIKRAIIQLRRRLDRRYDGPRGWAPLLGALSGFEVPASLLGGSVGAASGEAAGVAVAEAAPATAASGIGAVQGAAAAFLVGAVISGAATFGALPSTGGATRAGSVASPGVSSRPAEAASVAETPDEVEDPATRAARVRRANGELEARVVELRARVASLLPERKDPAAFRAGVREVAPSFDAVSWGDLARHVRAMSEALVEVKEVISRGEQPGRAQAVILEHNTPVATFAVAISPDLGAVSANHAFTHPTIVANLVRATLQMLEDALTHDQEVAIDALARVQMLDVEAAFASLPEDALVLEHLAAELASKMRFQAALRDVLTASQRAALFFPGCEGRVDLDMLSPGIRLPQTLRHSVDADDREDLERALLEGLFAVAGADAPDLAPFEWIGRQWVEALPDVLEPRSPYDTDAMFPRVMVAASWLDQQIEATRRVLAMGVLDEDQERAFREAVHLLRPRIRLPAASSVEPGEPEEN